MVLPFEMIFSSIFTLLDRSRTPRQDKSTALLNEARTGLEASFNKFVGTYLALQANGLELDDMPFSRSRAEKGALCTEERLFLRMIVASESRSFAVHSGEREVSIKTMPVTSNEDLSGKMALAVEIVDQAGVRYAFKFAGQSLFHREDDENNTYSTLSTLNIAKDGTVSGDGPCWTGFVLECFANGKRILCLPGTGPAPDGDDPSAETAEHLAGLMDLCSEILSSWADERKNLICGETDASSEFTFSADLRETLRREAETIRRRRETQDEACCHAMNQPARSPF